MDRKYGKKLDILGFRGFIFMITTVIRVVDMENMMVGSSIIIVVLILVWKNSIVVS